MLTQLFRHLVLLRRFSILSNRIRRALRKAGLLVDSVRPMGATWKYDLPVEATGRGKGSRVRAAWSGSRVLT